MAIPVSVPWMGHLVMEQSLLRRLLEEAKAGNEASFERIVILHQRLVLRVAQRLLLNSDDARDAAQEVFVRLHRSLGRFDERRELGPWLYRMTVNICRDIRRRSRHNVPLEPLHDSIDLSPDPETCASAAQQYRIVLAALATLSAREREVIVLRDLEGHSTGEVAGILGSPEGTVRSQLSTGRMKIRNYIEARLGKRT